MTLEMSQIVKEKKKQLEEYNVNRMLCINILIDLLYLIK